MHRMLVSYAPQRQIQGVEAQPTSDVVMEDYRAQYERNAGHAARELMTALEGAIRHGADPKPSKQLRAQLSRWLKKNRAQCKTGPDVV